MKLARYMAGGVTMIGVVRGVYAFDLAQLVPGSPTSIREVLSAGPELLQRITWALGLAQEGRDLHTVHLQAPIPDASKYLAIGMNYQDHAEEASKKGFAIPATQAWFNKQVSCIHGPYDPVYKPSVSTEMDYEAELGVVIGKQCRYVSEADARGVVGGYFVANDLSARDWQRAGPTVTLGKSFDTHGPTGPWIVTTDEIEDPHNLEMRLFVNGEQRQRARTSMMIFNIWQQIHYLSQVMTLHPGDLLATGTCSGVGMMSGRYLQPGDVVRVEIDCIGHIENHVVLEPSFN